MPAAPSIVLPRTFGRYALFDFIGKGGMAEIYLARQKTELGPTRRCVVKQILPEFANDSAFSDMLVHEAKLAARLSHTNVVQVFDLGREDGRLFIAMEYVEGFDLNDLLRRCSRAKVPLPFELAVHVVRESLKGLDYAHRRTGEDGRPLGIVHRDVSPSNLLVSFEGEVKVCDFGIAHANDALADVSSQRVPALNEALKGKAGYMSPEHARGEAIDARADVFAAGIVLWELAAGRRLYRATDDGVSLLEQARRAEIPPLPTRGLPVEEQLQAVVGRALSVDREARYASAAAMQRDLDEYAMRAKFLTSPLQLGDWVTKTFGQDVVARRRARERATAALERGAPLVLRPIAPARAEASDAHEAHDIAPASIPLHGRNTERPPASRRPELPASPRGRAARATVVALMLAMMVAAAVIALAMRLRG
jgi:eukaryotic-like serine/threonine-protein kinase